MGRYSLEKPLNQGRYSLAPPETINATEENEEDALTLAKGQIGAQYPNLPVWLRDAILKITPKDESPMLASAARGVTDVTDYIPSLLGGSLQGASIPIRGVAGLIPTEFTQNLSHSPDLTSLFPKAQGFGQETAQLGAELAGGGGLFGKLFQGAKYASQAAKVPKALQNTTALAASGAMGTPGDITDRLLGAGGALALGGAGKVASKVFEKAPKMIKGLFSESTPESLIESVQKPHDVLERSASELYDQVKNAIKKRRITFSKLEKNNPLDALIDQAKEYFPQRTTATRDLFERAKKGDYDAIHNIQSSLYKKGTKQLSGDTLVNENEGEEILDLRKRINDHITNHLIKEGHLDIAHALEQGKKLYYQLQKTYYDKRLPKGIGKLVHPELRIVPENPESLFKQNSVPMKRFLESHPDAAKHIEGLKSKSEAKKALTKLLYKTGGAGVTIAVGKSIYDLIK